MPLIRQSKKAFALSIVMWIVAALLLGIAFVVMLSRDTLSLTESMHDKLVSRLKAESVLEVLKFEILTSDFNQKGPVNIRDTIYHIPTKMILDGRTYKIGNISITMRDASSMVNVIHPNYNIMASLMTSNNERELFYTIRDSIRDWIDEDNDVRLNGAEESVYKLKKSLNYSPRNNPAIQSVDELRSINGVDRLDDERWKRVKKYFYFGDGSVVNLALIDENYLSKLLKLNFLEASMLKNYREHDYQKYISMIRRNQNYDNDNMSFALSFNIKIDIKVKYKTATTKIESLIDFRTRLNNLITVEKFEIY